MSLLILAMVVGLFVLVCVAVGNTANGPRPRPFQPHRTKRDSIWVDNNVGDNSVNMNVEEDHNRHGGHHHHHHDGHHHHHSWDFGGGHHHSGGFDGGGGGDSGGGSSD